jgi:MerR family copper efflux transcriptional regulator
MKTSLLPIREIAARSGVSVHTLRYYERAGLLPKVDRSPSGYRMYPVETVKRVRLVRVLRSLGFGIRELRGVGGVFERRFPRGKIRTRLRSKRDEVGLRMKELQEAWRILDALQGCRCRGDCALVVRLLDGAEVTPKTRRKSS